MPNELAFSDKTALARNSTPPLRITKRVKDAINAMVIDKARWDDAAVAVGLSTRAMRLALEKPHVIAYLRAQAPGTPESEVVGEFFKRQIAFHPPMIQVHHLHRNH